MRNGRINEKRQTDEYGSSMWRRRVLKYEHKLAVDKYLWECTSSTLQPTSICIYNLYFIRFAYVMFVSMRMRMHVLCVALHSKVAAVHSHKHLSTASLYLQRPQHTHTNTHAHTYTYTHTHTRTHAHTRTHQTTSGLWHGLFASGTKCATTLATR